jgi:hypothetical protein
MSSSNQIPVAEIAAMLMARIQSLVAELLPHGKRRGREWCVGSVYGEAGSSLSIHLDGAKAGLWKDFATEQSGDALDLVAAVRCSGSKWKAIEWACDWLGLDAAHPDAVRRDRATTQRQAERRQAEAAAAAERTRTYLLALWLASAPSLKGTPVEWYLNGRGIVLAQLGRQPRALRFHPSLRHPSGCACPAMVAAICDAAGQHVAVHRTWLEVLGPGHARKAPIEPSKAVLGSYTGGGIRLWRGASGRQLRDARPGEVVDITEGIEDGLSVALAVPESRVLAAVSLSNLGNLTFPPAVTGVRLWRQNDTKPEPIAAFNRAVDAYARRGLTVLVAEVPAPFKDANEMLAAEAVAA